MAHTDTHLETKGFRHYASKPLKAFKTPSKLGIDFKPHGTLWLSCGNDWMKWIQAEMLTWRTRYPWEYTIHVDTSKLLCIETPAQVRAITRKFGVPRSNTYAIDWDKIREAHPQYSGVYIKNPYMMRQDIMTNKVNLKYVWFQTFDVCSVALWSFESVNSVKLVKANPTVLQKIRHLI